MNTFAIGSLPVHFSVAKLFTFRWQYTFGAKNSLLWYATHPQRPAEQPTPQAVDSLLGYATRFQRRTVPKAALAAPDASSVRETPTARR